jgi:hypothetical protein
MENAPASGNRRLGLTLLCPNITLGGCSLKKDFFITRLSEAALNKTRELLFINPHLRSHASLKIIPDVLMVMADHRANRRTHSIVEQKIVFMFSVIKPEPFSGKSTFYVIR